jgi:hypothetical protein
MAKSLIVEEGGIEADRLIGLSTVIAEDAGHPVPAVLLGPVSAD